MYKYQKIMLIEKKLQIQDSHLLIYTVKPHTHKHTMTPIPQAVKYTHKHTFFKFC